jgi:tryptophanyl-tRNA synthetase
MVRLAEHYAALETMDRYEDVGFTLGDMSAREVRRRFVVGEDAGAFADEVGTDGVFTFGVSVTGPPHVGTLGQMQTAIALQDAGFDVHFLVADMEPYSTDGYALDVVRERARRFVSFVEALGFDPEQGRLRTQYGAPDVMHTAYRLSRYADPDADGARSNLESTAWEDANRDAYDADGVNAPDLGESDMPDDWEPSQFTRRMDGFLMVADMLHPIVADDYPANCIVMGADERSLRPMVEGVRERCGTDGSLHALYTRLVPGLNDYPKLSRRIPESRFTLADDPDGIADVIRSEEPAGGDAPVDDVVFEMMRLASAEPIEQIDAWRDGYESGGDAWADARAAFADEIREYARTWQSTAADP